MHRIVHLDCKGAPMKIQYLKQVLRLVKSWGATGILIEWEDTFPYSGDIADIGSVKNSGGDDMYSAEEVQHIFHFARDINLEAIQLVQTIGHMEFVLKHPAYRCLREVPSSPAVLCPSRKESQELVRKMIDQALDSQPDARYFHIGADEVWHKGECQECRKKLLINRHQSDGLYLEYIQDLTLYIKRKRPNIVILMWDDMLRPIDEDAFKAYILTNIQPVCWNYNSIEYFQTDFVLWQKYSKIFPKMWAGSAYKGANGSSKPLAPVARYAGNHEAWLREFAIYKNTVNFVGIILTGWARYDHYATMCELMPVMLPSLASCLRVLMHSNQVPREQLVTEHLSSQEWPGEGLALCIHSYVILKDRCHSLLNGDPVSTWLNTWQVQRGYTVSVHVQSIAYSARILLGEVQSLCENISVHLSAITGRRSTEEWLHTNIFPLLNKMTELFASADAAMTRDAGVRP